MRSNLKCERSCTDSTGQVVKLASHAHVEQKPETFSKTALQPDTREPTRRHSMLNSGCLQARPPIFDRLAPKIDCPSHRKPNTGWDGMRRCSREFELLRSHHKGFPCNFACVSAPCLLSAEQHPIYKPRSV